jgi:hypothetical protein
MGATAFREKVQTQKDLCLEQIDEIETRSRKTYTLFLTQGILRELSVSSHVKTELLGISDQALAYVVQERLRKPVEKIFEDLLSLRENE